MEVGGLTALTIALSAICVGGTIGGIIAMRQNWRKAQRIESETRQAILAKFWRDEMQRTKPNMLHLISGASFEKVPEHWQGWWFADSQIRKAARSLDCTYEQASAAFMAIKNRQ